MASASEKFPLEKIGRILLIPIFLFLAYSAMQSANDLSNTLGGYRIYNRSMTEAWPSTFARLDKGLILWHVNPYVKNAPFFILPEYSYRIGPQQCASTRFEFGPRKTDYTEVPAGDTRLNTMVNRFCSKKPLKTDVKDKTIYTYSCYPVQVYYDPMHPCISYIAKPTDPDSVRFALRKSMTLFGLIIAAKIILAMLCVWGALPLIDDRSKDNG